ncbi:helix-turn-helix domain-containing protein [Candidatus Arsenophonus triatominarum]|uniref:helix-turn-helix domain-containing protein n=1 Tax=Candidatus Arsenophonus triatominarum TaxID=57911 RepID=UPI0007C4A9C8|nr:helix-turn-helix domain-containing protein [Candidatus Arsenophonus triatominarum]
MNDQIDIRAKNFKSQFLEMNKEIISDMRNQGASFQQIADFLYENKKIKVSSITISRFLKRNS